MAIELGFFHGVSVTYNDTIPRAARILLSNVVFIVGTGDYRLGLEPAPINDPALTLNAREDVAAFGPKLPGFTLGYALDVLRDYECGHIWTVNVFDPSQHKSPSGLTDYTVSDRREVQLKRTDGAGAATAVNAHLVESLTLSAADGTALVEGTDYTIDKLAKINLLPTAPVVTGDTVTASYDFPDPSLVTPAEIIGDVIDGDRTGLQGALDVYEVGSGEIPKLIIAPWYSHIPAVAAELVTVTNKLAAQCAIDSPPATSLADVVQGRNGLGPATAFNYSDTRVMLTHCGIENSDGVMIPLSVHWCGRRSLTDVERGYWASWSNQPLRNAVRREQRISSDFRQPTSDANYLNSFGVSVPVQHPSSGLRSWGNRNSRFPSDPEPRTFECIQRNLDITLESAQAACLPFVGRSLTRPVIDQILATLQGLVDSRIKIYAMYSGSRFVYLDASNSALDATAGVLTLDYFFGMPTPAERINLQGTLDINLYENTYEGLINAN